MPMAGKGSRFNNQGFNVPKPLIELKGKPFFYWAVESILHFMEVGSLTFIVLEEHVEDFYINKYINLLYPTAKIITLKETPNGAAMTAMNVISVLPKDEAVLFNDCDHMFYCPSFYRFCQGKNYDFDGALLTFESNSPQYSYCCFDVEGNVIGTVEKKVVSSDAICGAYYFRQLELFEKACELYIRECKYNELFLSGVYNAMIQRNNKIGCFRVEMHRSFGTPEEFFAAKESGDFEVFQHGRT